MPELRLVPLATVGSPIEAKLAAARLGAAGIVWQLRGAVDDPYPLGDVTVLVDAEELEAARALLDGEGAWELDGGWPGEEPWWDPEDPLADCDAVAVETRPRWRRRLAGASALVAAAGFGVARVAAAVA